MKAGSFARTMALAAAALLASCSAQGAKETTPAAAPAELGTHPVSGLEIIPVTIFTDEERYDFRAEVAASPAEQARGLMFRTEMGEDEGMIFPYEDDPHSVGFWMRNTVIPLDIVFIGTDRTILNIAENAVPYSEESLRSDGPVSAVLELNGGLTARLGIGPGDRVEW